ncbi:MAG: MSEP-CTERM sorting domain-containing protein, partial [Bacteroidia bacterium]|nr:MSEP-CTERM sorting domain-containing protein [Bacteroidia bacterium]
LLLVSTLPVAVLFWIFWGTYDLIESQLSEKSIHDWLWLGGALATLWLAHSGYALFMIVKKRKLGLTYALVAFGLYVPFLYLYSMTYDSIIPAHIPGWMIADNLMLYAGTFIMPTLLHSLFIAAVVLTPEGSRRKAWPSFVFALLMPLGWYVIFQVILPLWKVVPHEFEYHAIIIVTITFVIFLIFFLLRGVYVLSSKKEGFLYEYRLLGRVVIAVLFPVAGLVVNSSKLFDCIFGNFNDPWFYIIAIANGIAVIMPERDDKKYRLVLFLVRSVTFSYIVYFFLVFLPYLPLSILAIIAFGLGFLMLTPLVLFVLQVNMMVNDFVFLFRHYQKRYVYAMFAACFAVLPLAVSVNYLWGPCDAAWCAGVCVSALVGPQQPTGYFGGHGESHHQACTPAQAHNRLDRRQPRTFPVSLLQLDRARQPDAIERKARQTCKCVRRQSGQRPARYARPPRNRPTRPHRSVVR